MINLVTLLLNKEEPVDFSNKDLEILALVSMIFLKSFSEEVLDHPVTKEEHKEEAETVSIDGSATECGDEDVEDFDLMSEVKVMQLLNKDNIDELCLMFRHHDELTIDEFVAALMHHLTDHGGITANNLLQNTYIDVRARSSCRSG